MPLRTLAQFGSSTFNFIRERGLLFSLGILYCRIVPTWIFRIRHVVVLELQASAADTSALDHSGMQPQIVQCISNQDRCELAKHCKTHASDDPSAEGWAIVVAEQIVGGVWIAREQFLEKDFELTILLAPDTRWLFSAFVLREFRRHGIYSWAVAELISQRYSESRVFAAINVHNLASIAAHRKLVRDRLATVYSIQFFGTSFSYCRPNGMMKGSTLVLPSQFDNVTNQR